MTPQELEITKDQYRNLEKLAGLLETVDRDKFDMRDYVVPVEGECDFFTPHEAHKSECGTVACAAGHLAKIVKPFEGEDWDDFVDRAIGFSDLSNKWCWLFSPRWVLTDNTALGASKRIKHLLENGVPIDWCEQMCDESPLCY